jgi:hypothetical protein
MSLQGLSPEFSIRLPETGVPPVEKNNQISVLTFPETQNAGRSSAVGIAGQIDHTLFKNGTGPHAKSGRLLIKGIVGGLVERSSIYIHGRTEWKKISQIIYFLL